MDASDADAVAKLVREHGATHVLNAVDPRFVLPIFFGAMSGGADYLDMAMSLSHPHPERPHAETGIKLGDEQFAVADAWEAAGRLALVGIGVEPGLSDVFARHAADHDFSVIEEAGVRDGANLVVVGDDGQPIFAPSFSIWTTIEECLNPPVIWEKDRGWFTTEPFSEPEVFDFPEGIGPVECVNVEHEEVLLIPRWVDAARVTFKYGLGEEFIAVLRTLHTLGLDSTRPVSVGAVEVSPRDVVAACLPDPATLGERMTGKTCAGLYVTGLGKDGRPRATYYYHVVDNAWSMAEYGSQAVVWQTALNPVVALELLASGGWAGSACSGRRPSRRRRTSTCWASTAPRGPRTSGLPEVEGGESLLDDAQGVAKEVLADDERGQEAQDVAVGTRGQHQHALGRAERRHLGRHLGRRLLRPWSHELDRDHRATAADVADDGVARLQVAQERQHHLADAPRGRDEVLLLDRRDRAECRGAGDRVAAVRAAEPTDVRGVHELRPPGHRGQRQAAGHRLGGHDEVGDRRPRARTRTWRPYGRSRSAPRRRRTRSRWPWHRQRARAGSPRPGR